MERARCWEEQSAMAAQPLNWLCDSRPVFFFFSFIFISWRLTTLLGQLFELSEPLSWTGHMEDRKHTSLGCELSKSMHAMCISVWPLIDTQDIVTLFQSRIVMSIFWLSYVLREVGNGCSLLLLTLLLVLLSLQILGSASNYLKQIHT